jgi:plastocyanin
MRSSYFIIFALATAVACGGDDGPSGPGESGNQDLTVTVANNVFDPSSLSVPQFSNVTWEWNSGGVTHNVTFQDGPASGNRTSGTYQRSFNMPGTYSYACTIHAGEGMTGTVTVTAGIGSGGTGGTGGGGTGGGGGGYP